MEQENEKFTQECLRLKKFEEHKRKEDKMKILSDISLDNENDEIQNDRLKDSEEIHVSI